MGLWTLFELASMPNLQVLIISVLGAFMATQYWNLFPMTSRRSLNKIVFQVFTPSLVFASLAKTVTLQDIISWWFMPVNIGFTFLVGGILGWILVKLLKPRPHLEGLIIATCSAGNLGNLLLILIPAICNEDGSPFGHRDACTSLGLSYVSFSMALGGIYIWTHTFQLIRSSAAKFKALEAQEVSITPNKDLDATQYTHLLKEKGREDVAVFVASTKSIEDTENQAIVSNDSDKEHGKGKVPFHTKVLEFIHQILEELLAPSTIAAIVGLIFGATPFLRNLIIGDNAPLHVIQDSIQLLGDGTIPSATLILGGNLTEGLRSSRIKPWIIIGVVFIRYIIAPAIGIGIVMAAGVLGFLPSDPLYKYVLMIQYTLPPAMAIGTMTQLFDVGHEECSVLFLWTYLVAAIALTFWSTVYIWILS